jgi:hypothetical protein
VVPGGQPILPAGTDQRALDSDWATHGLGTWGTPTTELMPGGKLGGSRNNIGFNAARAQQPSAPCWLALPALQHTTCTCDTT